MKCKHECELRNEIQHARNAEQRHLAEIGTIAQEVIRLKDEVRVLRFELEERIERIEAILRGTNKDA